MLGGRDEVLRDGIELFVGRLLCTFCNFKISTSEPFLARCIRYVDAMQNVLGRSLLKYRAHPLPFLWSIPGKVEDD